MFSRREFLRSTGLVIGASAIWPRFAHGAGFELDAAAKQALEESLLVYVSPLKGDGQESSCHGEVWFLEHEGDVVLFTAKSSWKTRALDRGWDQARIWVGDHGQAKDGEAFKKAPNFLAKASFETDQAVFDALLNSFATKYPKEWGKWEPRFKKGWSDGSRALIRYRPTSA